MGHAEGSTLLRAQTTVCGEKYRCRCIVKAGGVAMPAVCRIRSTSHSSHESSRTLLCMSSHLMTHTTESRLSRRLCNMKSLQLCSNVCQARLPESCHLALFLLIRCLSIETTNSDVDLNYSPQSPQALEWIDGRGHAKARNCPGRGTLAAKTSLPPHTDLPAATGYQHHLASITLPSKIARRRSCIF